MDQGYYDNPHYQTRDPHRAKYQQPQYQVPGEQDGYGHGHQGVPNGRASIGAALPFANAPHGPGQNLRATYHDPGPGRAYPTADMQQPVSNAPAPIPRPSYDWSGQQQMPRGEDPAARADWLSQLVLQMEEKTKKTETELRDFKAKHSGLVTRLEAQEAENDNLRENLSRLSRGQPATIDTESSDEQARMTVLLKRENQNYRQQVDELSKRNDVLQRSIQHYEKQQQGMSGENSNLMLRLQSAEQRTDQLMKQKATMDADLHNLRSQLATQQQQLAKQEHEFRHQMQQNKQLRERDSQKSQELKDLHTMLAQQQEEFEKQRVLMMHQRDGVEKVFEHDLNEMILKNQQVEAELAQAQAYHTQDVAAREAVFSQGIRELEGRLQTADSERAVLAVHLQQNSKTLEEVQNSLIIKTQMANDLQRKADELQDDARLALDSWGTRSCKAVSKAATARVFRQWRDLSLNGKINRQIMHTAFASTCTRWFRRSLKQRFLAWKSASEQTVSIADVISSSSKARMLRACLDDWAHGARWSAREAQQTAIEENTRMLCEQEEEKRLKAKEVEHQRKIVLLKESMTAETAQLVHKKDQERTDALKQMDVENKDRLKSIEESHKDEITTLQTLSETQMTQANQAAEKCKAAFEQQMNAKALEYKEEITKLNNLLESKRSEMDAEIVALKTKSDEVETALRKEIVEENVRLNSLIRQTQDDHAQLEREWRKKQLDKEREHSLQIEALERQKLEAEEEMYRKIQAKDRETDRKIEQLREECNTREEELRKKGYARDKEFGAKQEASRAEYLKAQEDFQKELQKKDEDFRKQLVLKEQEFQKHLESHMQGKITTQVQNLQKLLAEKDLNIDSLHKQIASTQQRHVQQQGVVDSLSSETQALKAQKEELARNIHDAKVQLNEAQGARQQFAQMVDAAATEVDSLKRRTARLEESLAHKDKELALLGKEKDDLASELGVASQTLLKRGDDFSESVRMLQRRLESSDAEVKVLHEKLKEMHAANMQLSSQLEQANGTTQQLKSRMMHAGGDAAKVAVLQEKLNLTESELQKRVHQHQFEIEQERSAARRTAEELHVLKSQQSVSALSTGQIGPGEVGALQARINELEMYVQNIEPRIDSTQRENDTLTGEMDKILAENAMLRNELDDLKERVENSRALVGHTPNMRRGSLPGTEQPSGPALLRPLTVPPPGYQLRAPTRDGSFEDERPRMTSGVHGVRLLRNVFGAWLNLAVDLRGAGRSASFSCLGYFCDNEGQLAPFMPVGRIRKTELNIKPEKIGSGTFADVFKGELKIPCAMKKMKGPMQQKEITEFVREGEMMRKVNHPSICKLLGVSTEQNQYTLVFEFVPGTNLFDYLHKLHKTIPLGRQLSISTQICDAMAYVHDCNLVHRDLKPQNVIYQDKTGVAKLCDFGLARFVPSNMPEINPAQLGTGGTPAYQGPEVLKRQPVSKKLDLYGFAIMMWEMYTSRLPWSDCNLEQMTTRVAIQNERPALPKDMPREYSDIIQRCWQRDPRVRPDFCEILPVLFEMNEALGPGPKLSSGSSGGSGSSLSTASTVVSLPGHFSTRAQGYQNSDPNFQLAAVAKWLDTLGALPSSGPFSKATKRFNLKRKK